MTVDEIEKHCAKLGMAFGNYLDIEIIRETGYGNPVEPYLSLDTDIEHAVELKSRGQVEDLIQRLQQAMETLWPTIHIVPHER